MGKLLVIHSFRGVNEETLLSAAISDCLVLVLRPDRQDYQGSAVMIELARQPEAPKMLVLINKAIGQKDFHALRQRVETPYGVEVAGLIPLSEDIAALGSTGVYGRRLARGHRACRSGVGKPRTLGLKRHQGRIIKL